MSFFDSLERFANDLVKKLSPEEIVNLKSCKNCTFYKKGYCTQTPVPTKILSEFYAQGCIYYATEQITTGLISKTERETVASIIDRVKVIDLANVEIIKAVVLDVNLISAPITVAVHETGTANVAITTSIDLNVNIIGSAITVLVHETGTADVSITSSIQLDINIVSSAITLFVQTDVGEKVEVGIVSSIELNINIIGSTITVDVHETGTAQVDITSSITLNMSITGSTINVPITNPMGESLDVGITTSVTLNISITGSTVNVPITTAEGEKVDVNIITSVTLNVAITSSTVTLNVNIQSQTVDINIKTSGGANIVIDKLTQTAYTERRSTISNDNGVTTPTAPPSEATGITYRGKFFPRGCRGFIEELGIYCKRTGAGTLTLAYSLHPSMGEIGSVDITPSADWDWKTGVVRRFWDYDRLFIWVKNCSVDVSWGYDSVAEKNDWFTSADMGVSWYKFENRLFIRAVMAGQTVSDIPVSGTLNTIEIPTVSTTRFYVKKDLPLATETTYVTIHGAGTCAFIVVLVPAHVDSEWTCLRVYCDGNLSFQWDMLALSNNGYTASTHGISLLKYTEDGLCVMQVTLKFSFSRKLEIKLRNANSAPTDVEVEGFANLIK